MFTLFAPSYIKTAKQLLQYAERLERYKTDIVSDATRADFLRSLADLRAAMAARDAKAVAAASEEVHKVFQPFVPPASEAGWRENCEVVLFAIVLAVGVRTYFLQPFKIPTGSMQPTLNGIIGFKTDKPMPDLFTRSWQFVTWGRTYVDIVSPIDDQVVRVESFTQWNFLDYSKLTMASGRVYVLPAPPNPVQAAFQNGHSWTVKAGEPLAQGYFNIGDHILVDKFTYNFRRPARDDIFVFRTVGIKAIERRAAMGGGAGDFYVKRLVGLPGDVVKVVPPGLEINNQRPAEPGVGRVMAAANGYGGYTRVLGESVGWEDSPESETDVFHVPTNGYMAMGDNSGNSWDSRNWGPVPEENAAGRGLFVFWPFSEHWGIAR